MPNNHPNVDTALRNRQHLPSDHPTINPVASLVPIALQCMNYPNYYTPVKHCVVNVSMTHPSVDSSIKNGTPLPAGHPLTDPLLRQYMPAEHPNIDTLIQQGKLIPVGHPSIDPYLCFLTYVPASKCIVNVTFMHPSIDSSIKAGTALPIGHPLTDVLLKPYMPAGHPNTDTLFKQRKQLPFGHPSIDPYLCRSAMKNYTKPSGCDIKVSALHPSVDSSINAGTGLPSGHPLTDPLLRPYMPDGHPNTDTLIADKTPLPFGHPSIDPYLCKNYSLSKYSRPGACPVNSTNSSSGCYAFVYTFHPSVDKSIGTALAASITAANSVFPSWHVSVDPLLRPWMPSSHPNIDSLLKAGTSLPVGHPSVDPYMSFTLEYTAPVANSCPPVPYNHPSVDDAIASGAKLSFGHPKVDPLLRAILPAGDIDRMIIIYSFYLLLLYYILHCIF